MCGVNTYHGQCFLFIPVDRDDCNPDPCQNGGNCVDGIDTFTCQCSAGLDGPTCDIGKVLSLHFLRNIRGHPYHFILNFMH